MQIDAGSKVVLDLILEKPVEQLTEEDLGFLWARQSYLTKDQMEKYESVLKKPTPHVADAAPKLNIAELRHQAKELGIKLEKNMTAPHLLALIDQVQFDKELEEEKAQEELAAKEAGEKEATGHKGNFDSEEEKKDREAKEAAIDLGYKPQPVVN